MSVTPSPIAPEFYADDPILVARNLLGAILVHSHPVHGEMRAKIVETEAYRGEEDQACHARAGRTPRTEALYGPPGHAYVYLIYGMYDLFNVVAWPEGQPAGILIRGVEPLEGIDGKTHGPGRLTRAMHINRDYHGVPLWKGNLCIMHGEPIPEKQVRSGPRIGVDYAGNWAQKPWRFWINNNPYVSVKPPKSKS